MNVIYGDRFATHKNQCSGKNWTDGTRCKRKIIYRTVPESAADSPLVVVFCYTHRYQEERWT